MLMSYSRPTRLALVALVACCVLVASPTAHGQKVSKHREGTRGTESTAGKVWSGAQDVALFALGMIGVNYRYGGNTPEGGLDCSGLVRYVFQQVTGVTLPRTSKEMSGWGYRVRLSELSPGDLVFFNTRSFAFSHVGIYLGDNRFIHAGSRGSEVEISRLTEAYWHKHFDGARRLVGVLPSLRPVVVSPATAGAPGTGAEIARVVASLPGAPEDVADGQ